MDANTLEAIKFVIANLVPIISAVGAVLAVFVSIRTNKKADEIVKHTNGMSQRLSELAHSEGVAVGKAAGVEQERARSDVTVTAAHLPAILTAREKPSGD